MKRYTHLTSEQRYQISNGLKEGYSQQAIADIIGVNQSTISREIRRNGPNRGRVRRQPQTKRITVSKATHYPAMVVRKSRPRRGRMRFGAPVAVEAHRHAYQT